MLLSYAYTRKRSLSLDESTIERGLVNGARITDTLKQITQKTNVDTSWREVSGKKRNWNSPEM